jgi:CRISPR-associated protein (TIGR03986 family)
MDKIRSPYNFVPLSSAVFLPNWGDEASHDTPFPDGICGTFELVVRAESPIFVRDPRTPKEHFQTPDGTYAIPGSSLRGALRNIVEIASFGKMPKELVNDDRYGVRDLHNRELYNDHMSVIVDRKPIPLVTAGWLRRLPSAPAKPQGSDDEVPVAVIEPCDFAKLEYALLRAAALDRKISGFEPGRKQSSVDKYERWGRVSREIDCSVDVLRRFGECGCLGSYGRVLAALKSGTSRRGTLVFTGQPQTDTPNRARRPGAGNPKHHDFVFFEPNDTTSLPVSRRAFDDFVFVHGDRGQQGRTTINPNPEWGFWKKTFDRGDRVPVFFLLEPNERKLRAFGLAMMFRLAYRLSVHDAVRNGQAGFGGRSLDLAECLFGRVAQETGTEPNDDAATEALAGRVSIGLAKCETNVDRRRNEDNRVTAVLSGPKATFYPSYMRQEQVGRYATFMDPDAVIAGWKRYRPRKAESNPRLPANVNLDKVATTFVPLPAGTTYRARVRVHNLKTEELGALVWAIRLGREEGAFHTIGMARPLGCGRAKLAVEAISLMTNRGEVPNDPDAFLSSCEDSYVLQMERFALEKHVTGGWRGSDQVLQLLGCAKPIPDNSDSGRYMQLDHPDYRNEFVEAKKAAYRLEPALTQSQIDQNRRLHHQTLAGLAKQSRSAQDSKDDAACKERAELESAYREGKHGPLLRRWLAEGGPQLASRHQIAKNVVVFVTRALKKDYPDVVEWLSGQDLKRDERP